jgi:hypothetical protein
LLSPWTARLFFSGQRAAWRTVRPVDTERGRAACVQARSGLITLAMIVEALLLSYEYRSKSDVIGSSKLHDRPACRIPCHCRVICMSSLCACNPPSFLLYVKDGWMDGLVIHRLDGHC